MTMDNVISGATGYVSSLRDGRSVFRDGQKIESVADSPAYSGYVSLIGATYDAQAAGDLVLLSRPPSSSDELRSGIAQIGEVDGLTSLSVESLRTLHTARSRMSASDPQYSENILDFVRVAEASNWRICQCVTDAKGDRSSGPTGQSYPDAYVRVVRRTSDGVYLRGAKMHVTGASLSHVLLVMPTKRMKPDESDYAVACAVDTHSPGVRIIDAAHVEDGADPSTHPFSARRSLPLSTVMFDDVFVPNHRVFLDGEVQDSAVFAHSLGLWLRAHGTAMMADDADMLVGLAQLSAIANGTTLIPHIKQKIAEMIIQATLTRAGLEAALAHAAPEADGTVAPDELFTNVAKYHAATSYPLMVRHLHDIAGGAVVSAPSAADLENSEVGEFVSMYFSGSSALSGEDRLKILLGIRDLTASRYGGWNQLANLHGAGGLHAQRLVARKRYDLAAAMRRAAETLGLETTHV